jgi:hypothetical protein
MSFLQYTHQNSTLFQMVNSFLHFKQFNTLLFQLYTGNSNILTYALKNTAFPVGIYKLFVCTPFERAFNFGLEMLACESRLIYLLELHEESWIMKPVMLMLRPCLTSYILHLMHHLKITNALLSDVVTRQGLIKRVNNNANPYNLQRSHKTTCEIKGIRI